MVERMTLVNLAERYASFAVIVARYETPMLLLGSQLLTLLLELPVELWKLGPEVLDTAVKEFLRDEEIRLNILLLYRISSLTRKDDKLSYNSPYRMFRKIPTKTLSSKYMNLNLGQQA